MSHKAIDLSWKDLSIQAGDKIVVHSSAGFCRSGQILAVMGSSGSGKTTLLSALAAQRLKNVTSTGQVTLT